MPCIGIFDLVLLVIDAGFHHFSYPATVAGLLACVVVLGLFPPLYRPFLRRKLYRIMKNGRPDGHPLELEIANNELISRVPAFSEGRFFRAAARAYHENEHVAILFVAKKRFLILPKRTLPEAAFVEIRDWMETTEPKKEQGE